MPPRGAQRFSLATRKSSRYEASRIPNKIPSVNEGKLFCIVVQPISKEEFTGECDGITHSGIVIDSKQ